MRITSADLAMLDVAHRTYLRTPECSRRLVEDYIDWLTDQLAQEAANPAPASKTARQRPLISIKLAGSDHKNP
jgi:hypothetical protein